MILLETIAAALVHADGKTYDYLNEREYDEYEVRAHYVMEALKNFMPTDAMKSYGHAEITNRITKDDSDMPHVWQAMIIAAQEEAK